MSYSGKHAECYDLFYEDKRYREEARYAADLIRDRFPTAKSILDLGCGTGLRCLELARQGYKVCGIDQSTSMLDMAGRQLAASHDISPGAVEFQRGDITAFQASSKYDAVISLFHVFSYLTTEAGLRQALDCSFANLNAGGVLLFDYWHGPGVLNDPPVMRTKVVENVNLKVKRTAVPQHLPKQHLVTLTVNMQFTDKLNGTTCDSDESYSLRYWFPNELGEAVESAGFQRIQHYAWMASSTPGPEVWQACTVAVKP
jgi:SAM-dependent methyltransferase